MKKKVTLCKELNMEMYTMTQKERFDYIRNVLDSKSIPYHEYNGNIVSARFFNEPMFVAHLDTVSDLDMVKPIFFDRMRNVIYRDNGILGADDIAGCAILLNNIEDINFGFFRDEEIGGLGSDEMTRDRDFLDMLEHYEVNCFIELDRMGNSDIIGYSNFYCEKDLEEAINSVLTGYKPERGVWTDIDNLKEILPGVNLSVGYYNQHRHTEYLCIDEFLNINSKIPDLKSQLAGLTFKSAPEDPWKEYYKNYSKTNGGWSGFSWLQPKKKLTDNMVDYVSQKYCMNREDIVSLGYDFLNDEGMLDEYYSFGFDDEEKNDDKSIIGKYLQEFEDDEENYMFL
ncbi:MAG: hypothetical protein ACRDD8_16135 [Bacteroidales bacterium]